MKNIHESLNLSKDTAIMLNSPHNMRYFSGFSGGEGVVLICDNASYIFVDSRYTGIAKEEAEKGFEVLEFGLKNPLADMISDKLNTNNIRYILFEDEYMSASTYNKYIEVFNKFEFIPKSAEIERLRMIKSDKELEFIRQAEQISVDAFNHVIKYIKPGVSECDIAAELEYYMKKQGADGTSFDTIVLSSERTALPHGMPSNHKFKIGDFVLMDFGCKYKGYCSDMTRTVAVGDPSKQQKEIYEIVKQAQQIGIDTIKCGIKGCVPDFAAREYITQNGYGDYFGHSLGHGVGLLIHELPNLSPTSEIVLEENMVVSCEPGIYIYGFCGVRIEDLICVKQNGIENFTNLTKELIILG